MNIIANHHEEIGCSYHRVLLPATYMGNMNLSVFTWTQQHTPTDDRLRWANIVWFNRVPTFSIDALLKKREEFGFKIVVDVDDHWVLYPHHEMAAVWARNKTHEQIQRCISIADAVIVTNDRLKVAVEALNKNVYVIPNGLPYNSGQFNLSRIPDTKVRFMYTGGSSHFHDLKTIASVFKKLGSDAEFRAKGTIILAGYNQQFGTGRIDNVSEKMLKIIKPAGNYEVFPIRPVASYMECYTYADVSLAPLEDSTFNAHKSDLKILEAGCKCIPIIASNVEPYSVSFYKGTAGVTLCNTPDEWFNAIKSMLRNPTSTYAGTLLGEKVRAYSSLGITNRLRERVFNKLYE